MKNKLKILCANRYTVPTLIRSLKHRFERDTKINECNDYCWIQYMDSFNIIDDYIMII